MMNILEEILNPKHFDYELSEKLFLDIWGKWGNPEELSIGEEIFEFLNEVIERSNGYVIVDHFSGINYDNIHCIKFEKPYTSIYWKDNNKYREKYLAQELTEGGMATWCIHGYATYLYMLFHIEKIRFIKKDNHLFILILSHLIPNRKARQFLLGESGELIDEECKSDELYTKYMFWEGDERYCIKHICTASNLPYYTCLIQPKEGNLDTMHSTKLLLEETFKEIDTRMKKVLEFLNEVDDYDYDEIFAKGNTIRRIMEYVLKYFCAHQNIDIKITEKYGNILLKTLRNRINNKIEGFVDQSIITIANELSHDSGIVFSKCEVVEFWNSTNQLFEKIKTTVSNI